MRVPGREEHIKIEVVDGGGRGAERERKKERGAREMGRKLHTWLGREAPEGNPLVGIWELRA